MSRAVQLERVWTLTPEVGGLLALAMYPDDERRRQTLERYRHDPALQLYALTDGGRPVAAAGLRVRGTAGELLHLGTRPDAQGRGHGRALVSGVMDTLQLSCLTAETDDAAVQFYRRCGFQVTPTVGAWGPRYAVSLLASRSR